MLNHPRVIGIALILVPAIIVFMHSAGVRLAWADELDDDSAAALRSLSDGSIAARALGQKAAGILVFPNIVKAGFLFGAQFGEGTLFRGGRKVANYRSVAASYGFQAGVQAFGYAMFFMTDAALDYLNKSDGWEVGMGPSLVVIGEVLDLLENETGMHSCLASKPKIAGWRRRQEEASPWSREYRPRSGQARSSTSC